MANKTILFIIPNHNHGGTNKSLQNILLEIDKGKYSVLIYSIYEGGVYSSIFRDCSVERGNIVKMFFSNKYISALLKKFNIHFYYRFINYIFKREAFRVQARFKPDIVISFQEGLASKFGRYFKSSNNIAWVQCDYAQYKKSLNDYEFNEEHIMYRDFKKIICVSKCTMMSMKSHFPEISDRISFSYNILNIDSIIKLSQNDIEDKCFDTSVFTILSVGRFESVKRFNRIPSIVHEIRLRNPNKPFKWYIIAPKGSQDSTRTLEEMNKYQVDGIVVLLGGKMNPYPYIKKTDLLVCLSESESWSYVLNEAKLLHTPVVTTDFEAAFEVVDKEVGIITSIDNISSILFDLINNTQNSYSSLKESACKFEYSNELSIRQFNQVLET